jgi:hypothetical protein
MKIENLKTKTQAISLKVRKEIENKNLTNILDTINDLLSVGQCFYQDMWAINKGNLSYTKKEASLRNKLCKEFIETRVQYRDFLNSNKGFEGYLSGNYNYEDVAI